MRARVHGGIAHNQPAVEAAPCPRKDDGQTQRGSSTQRCHSALSRKDVLTPGTAWTNLEAIMLSDTSPSQKDTHCVTPLLRAVTVTEMERTAGARGTGAVV